MKNFKLDVIQLHGKETIADIQELRDKLKEKNFHFTQIWKAVAIKDEKDLELASFYDHYVDVLLFDTKGPLPGGNGVKFDWNLLEKITLKSPLMLSGGIKIDDTERIEELAKQNKIWGVDINSGFEINPGLKDLARIKRFVDDVTFA
jgi:phosphoribosylanthranilate isomerase